MLTNHANAYLYCKSIQNKLNIATIYQKITYISYDILSICIKIQYLILISSVLLNILIKLPHLLWYGEYDGVAFLVGLGCGVDVVRLVVGSKANHVLSPPAFPHQFSQALVKNIIESCRQRIHSHACTHLVHFAVAILSIPYLTDS